MHKLRISDFDKEGWNIVDLWGSTQFLTKDFEEYIIEAFFKDNILVTLHLTPHVSNCSINTVQINIDEITTVQEIEQTAEALYNAIQGV